MSGPMPYKSERLLGLGKAGLQEGHVPVRSSHGAALPGQTTLVKALAILSLGLNEGFESTNPQALPPS